MWVKICANTNLQDALAAIDLGADALGFVFAPSPRQVTAAQVRTITMQLPLTGVERIGVFAGMSPVEIAAAVHVAQLTGVQLHESFQADFSLALRALLPPAISIMQTAHWCVGDNTQSRTTVADTLATIASHAPASRALIDARIGSVSGGTGIPFDWSSAVPVFRAQPELSLILAGGLNPGNVAEAILTLKPWGVDVASGVESSPGRKDPAKLAAFIQNARQTR